MRSRTLTLTFLLATSVSAWSDSALTPTVVLEKIKTFGARPTLQAIYSDKENWERLLAGIATGTKDWLSIANQLVSVSDAGSSQQLGLAVGEALEHQPENVLSLTFAQFGLSQICGGPDVDNNRFNSYELSITAITKRQAMVRSVKNESLYHLRDSCVVELEKAKIGIAHFYGKK